MTCEDRPWGAWIPDTGDPRAMRHNRRPRVSRGVVFAAVWSLALLTHCGARALLDRHPQATARETLIYALVWACGLAVIAVVHWATDRRGR
jgi:hypothetical protein